jgi:ribonuclease Z
MRFAPTPSVIDANTFFPGTEKLGEDEMRIPFMGSLAFPPRLDQAGTCMMVEFSDQRLFFDFGPGCLRNIIAMRVPIGEVNDIFLTHLHLDHFGDLPYLYNFAAHAGARWTPLRVIGPSGSSEEFGTRGMIEGLKRMSAWNVDSVGILPSGGGLEIEVNEFDWLDDGGVCWTRDGAVVTHWARSHTKDGPSAYRLDWNGLSFVYTGDGRPDSATIEFARGADVFVTEAVPDLNTLGPLKWSLPPKMFRYIIDTHHTPHYAAGYMMSEIEPRLGVITHLSYDRDILPELVDGVREHWKGPLAFGIDLTVINVTKTELWVREATVSSLAHAAPPSFARLLGVPEAPESVTLPRPAKSRETMQVARVRERELDPALYYPSGRVHEHTVVWPEIVVSTAPVGGGRS